MAQFARRMRKLGRDPVAYLLDSRHGLLRGLGGWMYRRESARFLAKGAAAADVKITVIMTAYETGHLIEKAVRSVMAQSHENLELMVIDDASTDNTLAVLERLAKEDSRIRVFSSPTNHGTYWSKNWCLARAEGAYVAFHDSDDYSALDRLQMQLGALLSLKDAVACTCRWQRVDAEGRRLVVDGAEERMAAISLMIEREAVLRQAGFFDTVRIAADTEFIKRLGQIFGSSGIKHMRQRLYTGLLREGSLTTAEGSGFDWAEDGDRRDRTVGGDRAAYYKAFTDWHLACDGEKPKLYMPFPAGKRRFDVPAAMLAGCDDPDVDQVREVGPCGGQGVKG
ncbi:MAG: glycosyltransferase family 2 protein [Alphaproteobacteria bacterium]|nr:glycosyltransferase family 2 protein [Alphaproteobacteria bacterium]